MSQIARADLKSFFFLVEGYVHPSLARIHQVLRVLSLFATSRSVGKGRVIICMPLINNFQKSKDLGFTLDQRFSIINP
jgi:hypothetical protein